MMGEHTTGSLLQCWQMNYSQHHIAISPYPADEIPSTFCCYLHHHFFNRLRLQAGHYTIPAQQQALSVKRHLLQQTLIFEG
jgi:hypothetical protein